MLRKGAYLEEISNKTYLEGTTQTQSGPYKKLEMKVPLYSKQAFSQNGAELIRTVDEWKRKIPGLTVEAARVRYV